MSRNITQTTLFILLLSAAGTSRAQQWLGRTTGNYSGTYGTYYNASSIADSKYKYYFNFWGRGVNFYNNFLTYNAPIKINHWANNNYDLQYQNTDGNVDMRRDWLLESLNGESKQFSFNQDIWGPAFMFPVSKRWNMSVNTRQRSSFQMFGISEEVARMAHNGLDSAGGIYSGNQALNRNVAYNNGAFAANMQSFQELSFTLGGILARNDHHQLNGGATLKLIRGLGAAYIKGDGFNITATGDNSATINGDLQYAYTDQKSLVTPFNDPYGLFSLKSRGGGAGLDLGLTYTYSSKRLKFRSMTGCDRNDRRSDYDFKLALGLNDLGGIRYNKMSNTYSYSSTANANVTAPSNILDAFNTQNQNGLDTIGQKVFSQLGASVSNSFNTTLPAAVNLQVDFRINRHLYTGIYWNQSLKGLNSIGMRSTSMVSVIPRFESRGFEFSMPLTLSENYKNFYVGAYTRIGPVFFGSDNLGGLLNVASAGQFSGADIYGGVSLGIGHCHTWWYENKVDPVYMDSTDSLRFRDTVSMLKRDTLRITKYDTIRIIKKDTVYVNKKTKEVYKRDTVYIEKTVKPKPYNESEAVKTCKTQNTVLTEENVVLKTRVSTRDKEILDLKKQLEDLRKQKASQDTALLACKTCTETKARNEAEIVKLKNDLATGTRKIADLEHEILELKKTKNNADVVKVQKQADSLRIVVTVIRAELENCRKNNTENTAEVVRKAENDKKKAENDARVVKKQNDSLLQVLVVKTGELDQCKKNSTLNASEVVKKAEADKIKAQNEARVVKRQYDSLVIIINTKTSDLENCKKNAASNSAEVIKKAEADKVKAENEARVVRKRADSLAQVLVVKTTELENCRKNSSSNTAEVVKKAEADKVKAENDARVVKKTADSLTQVLIIKITDLENCKKNSTLNSAEAVKKAEAEKAKAENDARVVKKQADSLAQVLALKTTELETSRKNAAQYDAEVAKNKKCADENAMLKAEMNEMSKTIGKVNSKNYALSTKVDSLLNELKNCGSKSGSGNDAELLKKCQDANNDLSSEVSRLKNTISARDKSLDSMKGIEAGLVKKQAELNARIVTLNFDLEELKTKANSNNSEALQKEIDEKNAEITKLKSEAASMQTKINTLNSQLTELRTEYSFMVKQSQRCNQKLDSCMKGLYHADPLDKGPEDGGSGSGSGTGGGPNMEGVEGSHIEENREEDSRTSENNTIETPSKGLVKAARIGGAIINIMQSAGTSAGSNKEIIIGKDSRSSNTGRPTGNTTETTGRTSGTKSSGTAGTSGSTGGVVNSGSGNSVKTGTTTTGSGTVSGVGTVSSGTGTVNTNGGSGTGAGAGNNKSNAGDVAPVSGVAR